MSSWTIYSKSGVAKWTVKDPEYHDTWMGEEFITVSIVSAVPLQLEIGDYLTYRGLTYSIYNIPSALKQARRATYGEGFKYDNVKFSARSTELTETRFLDYVLFDNELHYTSLPTFSFYCNDVDDLVDRLQANTYRKGDAQWYFITPSYLRTIQRYEEGSAARTQAIALWISVFGDDTSVEPEYEKTDVNISVDKQSVWDGMSHIKKEFGLNYVTRDRVCIIGGEGIAVGHIFKYGKGEGLYQIERSADPDQLVVTKLYAYGSDKNLPLRYYSDINMRPYLKITGDYHTSSTETTLSVELETLTNPALAFTNMILDNGALQWYIFNCKIGDIECGGQVEIAGGVRLLLFATGTPSGVDNTKYTTQANIEAIKDAIDGGEEDVIFLTDVNINQFPSDRKTALTEGLPNNMAVNALMLPGFPMYPLSDLCRYTYDSVNDKTTYEIRKTPTSEYNEFMVVDGNHPITFSSNALDPFLLSGNYTELGTKEGDAHFVEENDDNGLQEVYPSIEGMTVGDIEGTSSTERLDEILECDVITDNGIYEEGVTVPSFHLVLKDLGFNLKEAFDNAGGSMTLSMKDGYCGGRDFSVKGVVAYTNGTWKLTVERCHDEALDLWFPYSYNATIGETPIADEAYQIRTGDHFVLTGIDIGDTSYVWAASMKMLRKSILWLLNNDYTRFTYLPHVDEIYMARQHDEAVANSTTSLHDTLKAGMLMLFEDDDLDVSGSIFIDSLTIKEHGNNGIPTYDVVLREDKQVGTLQRIQNQISSISSYISGGGGGMSVEAIRSLISTYGGENFLSKTIADAAQGVITFVKGLLFGNGETGITQNGDATLTSVQTKGYSGTDIVSDKGFKVWEDSEGKSHLITDYFSARVKAFFASLEIRKIEHSAGNRIESPAGNTLALVKKYGIDSHGDPYEIVDKWYARRYGFGLSWGFKLVYSVGQYFGFWQEDPSATVAFFRCYWTADDKEAKKAVENNWKIGDQAFCQTFNLRVPQDSGFASNKRYWRLVVGTGYETIEGVEYAYIDLSNEETLYLEASKIDTPIEPSVTIVDGNIACSGYDTGSDRPEAGDDVACLGNQVSWTTRGGAIQYITYGEVDTTTHTGIPCVKMYAGINNFTALDNFCFKKESPLGVFVRSNMFEIISASGTGDSSPIYCQRGAYSGTDTYGKNDIVQYHGASWLYINDTPSSGHAPAEGEYWTAFAQRGMGTPQVELDSVNAVVSANYEGKITNISAATGLPTTIEVYVDGNQIPVSAWSLANSYVKYYNNTISLNSTSFSVAPGIGLNSITAGANAVTLSWRYRQEIGIGGNVDPVINPTDIVVHVVFTYNGETYSADISAPMIVQKAAASVLAQYSADGTNWEDSFNESHGHIYVRYSYDGGSTWTSKIRIVGKSIEFERGIRHFSTYSALWSYLDGKTITADDIGYYLADTDDSSTPVAEATLWNLPSTDIRQLAEVSISNEVNYLTSYDGHLWNADSSSTSWLDMGVIQGADGEDGISVTLDPATVIFEQDENDTSKIIGVNASPYFSATVRVWQGTTALSGNFITGVTGTNCTASYLGNVVTITAISKDSNNKFYPSGKVEVAISVNGATSTLTLNWAANLLGSWKASVVNDAYTSVSSKPIAIINSNGEIVTTTFETIFQQTAEYIMLDVSGFAGQTGIDLEDGTITLKANKVTFTNSAGTVSNKISIDPTTGTLHATDGDFQGTLTAKNYLTMYADLVTYRYDEDGMSLSTFVPGTDTIFYDENGDQDDPLDVSSYWCFKLDDFVVELPTNTTSLIGQRIVLYNENLGIGGTHLETVIRAGSRNNYHDIRGIGLPNGQSVAKIGDYTPVMQINFCNGIVELQCVPGDGISTQCDWCVINLGTNLYELRSSIV